MRACMVLVKPIPDEFNTVSAHLTVSVSKEVIAFYQQAFGTELMSDPT